MKAYYQNESYVDPYERDDQFIYVEDTEPFFNYLRSTYRELANGDYLDDNNFCPFWQSVIYDVVATNERLISREEVKELLGILGYEVIEVNHDTAVSVVFKEHCKEIK